MIKAADPHKISQKNENMVLLEGLVMGTEKMGEEEKIGFLTGYVCCLISIPPEPKSIVFLKNSINSINEACKNKFISNTNFIQILVEQCNFLKKLKGPLPSQKLLEKFSQGVGGLIGEVMDNRRYIRQKWMANQKPIAPKKKKEEQMDEQTKRLIQMLQQQDLQRDKARKTKEKQSEEFLMALLKEQQKVEKQRIQRKMQKQYDKIKCEICVEDIPYTEIGALSCGHIFHKSCIRSHIEALIKQKKIDIPCPSACGAYLPIVDIEQFIDGDLKEKYDKFCFDVFVERNGKDTSWCPTAGCTAVFTHDEILDNYRCPVCRKHYCLNCRCEYHTGMSCVEYRISNSFEENDKKFNEFVIGAKFKQCPKCKFWVERTVGCNSMACRCGSTFCYDCGGTDCPHGSCKNAKK